MNLKGAVMVCGTASDVGKSRIVAGLCRVLARRAVRVAPFKAQNMALNSFVTDAGEEVGRSQAHQAAAARTRVEVAMNPILLKPTGEKTSQLVVMGRPVGDVVAAEYGRRDTALIATVGDALEGLRRRYDVVVAEGAGGAAEINLLEGDLVNLPLARRAGIPAILVGDIERGGVFGSIYGTVALLPEELRAQLRGFVINKFRGEERLLSKGIDELERRCALPCLGVLPHLGRLVIDGEDSLALDQVVRREPVRYAGDVLDVVVVAVPHLSNFTDFDPLSFEPGVNLRYVTDPGGLRGADLIILPGSKATVADLDWLRRQALDRAISEARRRGSALLGICAGYQMLGTRIIDDVESCAGEIAGLGMIDATTIFSPTKTTRRRRGSDGTGAPVCGYEIRHGCPVPLEGIPAWFRLDDESGREEEGLADGARRIWATSLHGIFESDPLRHSFLAGIAQRRGKNVLGAEHSFEARRQAEIDLVADALEAHLDLPAINTFIGEGALQ